MTLLCPFDDESSETVTPPAPVSPTWREDVDTIIDLLGVAAAKADRFNGGELLRYRAMLRAFRRGVGSEPTKEAP